MELGGRMIGFSVGSGRNQLQHVSVPIVGSRISGFALPVGALSVVGQHHIYAARHRVFFDIFGAVHGSRPQQVGSAARFFQPYDIVFHYPSNSLFVFDAGNVAVRRIR